MISFKENFQSPEEKEKSLRGNTPHVDEIKPVGDFDATAANEPPNPMDEAFEEDSPDTGYNQRSTDDFHPYDDLPPNNKE